jgi:hypothetical protein
MHTQVRPGRFWTPQVPIDRWKGNSPEAVICFCELQPYFRHSIGAHACIHDRAVQFFAMLQMLDGEQLTFSYRCPQLDQCAMSADDQRRGSFLKRVSILRSAGYFQLNGQEYALAGALIGKRIGAYIRRTHLVLPSLLQIPALGRQL